MNNQTRNIRDWEKERPEQYACALKIEDIIYQHEPRHIILQAPEKSGKREIIEILATREYKITPNIFPNKIVYCTALNRRDMLPQIKEMNLYNIDTYCTTKKNQDKEVLKLCKKHKGPHLLVIALDESDYGTGKKQKTAKVLYNEAIKNPYIRFIFISATNEEAIFSDLVKNNADTVEFRPHLSYRGFKYYLDNNLVFDPEPFYTIDNGFSEQAKQIIDKWNKSNKPIAIVRLLPKYNEIISSLEFNQFLWANNIECVKIDQNNAFDWGNDYTMHVERYNIKQTKSLYCINQTFTRGTECKFHKYIEFYHDYRQNENAKNPTPINTIRQAAGRLCVYDNTDVPALPTLYVHKEPLLYAIGDINVHECKRALSARIKTSKYDSHKWKIHVIHYDCHHSQLNVNKLLNTQNCNPRNILKEKSERSKVSYLITSPMGMKKADYIQATINNKKIKISRRPVIIPDRDVILLTRPDLEDELKTSEKLFSQLTGMKKNNLYSAVLVHELDSTILATTNTKKTSMYVG